MLILPSWYYLSVIRSSYLLSSQEPTTLTTRHKKRKRTTKYFQTVSTFTTGRWHQMLLLRKMTPPVLPTPTSPIKMWSKTTTLASLALCSSASKVTMKMCWCFLCFFTLLLEFWTLSFFLSLWAGSLDESGQQAGIHHEYVFLFGVFDESRSKYEPSGYTSDNHVKYTINGYTNGSLPGKSV